MARTSYQGLIVSAIGEFGLAQFLIVMTVKMSVTITAYAMVMTSLLSAEPQWWFYTNNHNNLNESRKYLKTCPKDLNISGNILFEDNIHTIVTEWKLVCELAWIPRTIMTIQMVGAILSPPIIAQFADWCGRKTSLLATYCIVLASVLGHGLSSNWQTMMGMAFILGFGIAGVLVVCDIYYLEFVGTKWRTLTGSLPSWAIGVMILGSVWFYKPSWRYVCFINFIAGCPILILLCLSPESIRWMLTRGHIDKAKRTLATLAKLNKQEALDMNAIDEALGEDLAEERLNKNYTYCSLLQHQHTRWRTVIFSFIWFSMSLGYYAITFGVGTFEGNMGVNMFLQGVAEVLAVSLVLLASPLAGRRCSSFILITITSTAMFGITIAFHLADPKTYDTMKRVLALAAKLFLTAAWVNITLFTIESFPTVVRNIAYGLASLFARIAGALAPQHINLHNIATHLPFTFNGILQMTSGILCLCLTDTYSSELDDHFHNKEEELSMTMEEIRADETKNGSIEDE